MVFGFTGGSASASSTKSNKSFENTTMPIVPGWADSLTQNVAGRVGHVAGLDPNSLVAGAQSLQNLAGEGAAGLSGMPWNFDGAAGLLRGVAQRDANTYAPASALANAAQVTNAQAASSLENLDAYMSPYRTQVVDSALRDFDYQAGQTRAQQALDLAGAGAFGGSGAALTQSMTEDALARGRASTSSDLLDQMFNRGMGYSADDANRRQQVSMANAAAANQAALANAAAANQVGLANAASANDAGRYNADAVERVFQRQMDVARGLTDLSTGMEGNQRANITTQAGVGETLRGIEQAQRQAPVTHTQQVVAMLSGLPINLFTGQQNQGTETSSQKTKSAEVKASW